MCLQINRVFPNNDTFKNLRLQYLNFNQRHPGTLRMIGGTVLMLLFFFIGLLSIHSAPKHNDQIQLHKSIKFDGTEHEVNLVAQQTKESKNGIKNQISDLSQDQAANKDEELKDPEALIDGSKGKPIPVTEWGTTYGPLRVWCYVIAVYDEEMFLVIQDSWGRFCDKLFFVVDVPLGHDILENEAKNTALPADSIVPIETDNHLREKGHDLWKKCWEILQYLEDHYHGKYDYVLRADADTWFSVNNFKSYAQYFDPKLSWFMGHTELHSFPRAFQAGGNYALSVGVVERLVEVFRSPEFDDPHGCTKRHDGWPEDVWITQCLRELGVYPLNTLNEQHQLRWSPFNLGYTKSLRKADWWYWKHRFEIHPVGDECCDQHMIGLHGHKTKDPSKLREWYQKLDDQYEADKTKDNTVPPEPTTFLFSTNTSVTRLKNKDINYRHQ